MDDIVDGLKYLFILHGELIHIRKLYSIVDEKLKQQPENDDDMQDQKSH